jgi:hypothetical protein
VRSAWSDENHVGRSRLALERLLAGTLVTLYENAEDPASIDTYLSRPD